MTCEPVTAPPLVTLQVVLSEIQDASPLSQIGAPVVADKMAFVCGE